MLKELDLSPYIIIKHTPTHTCMPFNTYTDTQIHISLERQIQAAVD